MVVSRGSHIAITEAQRDRLTALESDDDRLDCLHDLMDEVWDSWGCALDKAWDCIHRILTEHPPATEAIDPEAGIYPLRLCILGSSKLDHSNGYLIRLIEPADVRAAASALAELDDDLVVERYWKHCEGTPYYGEEDREYVVEWLAGMRDFFQREARDGRVLVFSADESDPEFVENLKELIQDIIKDIEGDAPGSTLRDLGGTVVRAPRKND